MTFTLFWIIVLSIPLSTLFFGLWINRTLKSLPPLRKSLLVFITLLFLLLIVQIFMRNYIYLPKYLTALLYIWCIVILPVSTFLILLAYAPAFLFRRFKKIVLRRPTPPDPPDHPDAPNLSRRRFLAASAAVLPPLVAFGGAGVGVSQFQHIRIRRYALKIPALPKNLDGLTLAQVSDLHIGNFVDSKVLNTVVELTNQLRPDFICFTGDLIDHSLFDLPAGIAMLRRLDPKSGLILCEGNHDLFESPAYFRQQIRNAGFNLLTDQSLPFTLRNQQIQFLATAWGDSHNPQHTDLLSHAHQTLSLLNPDAFPILLSHHPHGFDPAIAKNIPLTLSGHTHGGQIMLLPNFGPGPLMYKYFSGLYQRKNSSLIVSNGAGNWFPLRINAPAEIIHITLRS